MMEGCRRFTEWDGWGVFQGCGKISISIITPLLPVTLELELQLSCSPLVVQAGSVNIYGALNLCNCERDFGFWWHGKPSVNTIFPIICRYIIRRRWQLHTRESRSCG